ncbi:BrnT family toxin [Alkalinema sp. FACHB-956]|uniref:BrnT family toxin n=1 Tax=Alkalinema sp. FACHB-956 TaxID=2692768 RepID=UPI001685DE87|nr:BrnT family toxin [Alkalinema sp. FACHB-956]MBD2328000.1 BrnT family toxin [Alkalinema sp. FACHB-956]
MDELEFEWNPLKAEANERKHGVSFEEAESVFYDEYARLIPDPDHSIGEERFILLGVSEISRLLTVVHLYKGSDRMIRIISARPATKQERHQYEEFLP